MYDFLRGDTYFIGSDGKRLPLRIESIDFSPGYIGNKIEGYLMLEHGLVGSNKKDSTIKKVIFNDPATIVIWGDNTKTVVKCQPGDKYDKKLGLALCLSKKLLGNKGNYNEVFKKWIDKPDEEEISVELMRDKLDEYCDEYAGYLCNCEGCKLESCRCGNNAHFRTKLYGKYTMSDDEIRHAYKIAFEN